MKNYNARKMSLERKHADTLLEMEQMNTNFKPFEDDVDHYARGYDAAADKLKQLECKYAAVTKNINRKMKRKDEKIKMLEGNRSKFAELEKVTIEVKEDLRETKDKLIETEKQCVRLQDEIKVKRDKARQKGKQTWYYKKRSSSPGRSKVPMNTSPASETHISRITVLQRKVQDLEGLLELLQDDDIQTFEGGRYTDEICETIMELLSLNVSMSKVSTVIRLVLRKLAKKDVARMPSIGTISQFALEARHLADIEIAQSMLNNTTRTLGNCIHGDGTTKYHKKYQNWQVTLPDGTQKSFGLMEMAQGNTDAVMHPFKHKIQELANALGAVDKGDPDRLYKELITSISATMTDQGPTMPQFSDRVESLRRTLLPEVVEHWETLPEEVQKSTSDFGTFYCKMHPLINFAEEINRTLKAFEDICTDGKGTQALFSGESGATRLVRTASKAFHHRGSDKCGIEDSFTAYLEHEYDVKNHLVHYVGQPSKHHFRRC